VPLRDPCSRTVSRVIRFEKVTKRYPGPGTPALEQVTVDVDKGEFVYLVGQSGSGKSTALRLVLRELRPTSGRVYVAGKEINRMAGWKVPRLRRQIGTVFQDFRLLPNKNVAENVAFALQVIGRSRREINRVVPETLELVGLKDKAARMPDELSGGEQQRVAIARAFVNRPMILIADEPTGNLDPATSQGIMRLLEDINATGTTVVMATHDHGLVDQFRKRVVELEHGRVVRDEAAGSYGFQH
jgi:cell division transport system ATP-binding protein